MFTFNKVTRNNRNWNSKSLVGLSQNLGQAYCPGLNNVPSNNKSDSWTTDKFVAMSRHLSSASGVDF